MADNDSTTSANLVLPCHIMDIVKCIATPVLGHLAEPLMQEAKCLFCAHKVIKGLENPKKELKLKKVSMQSCVKQAQNRNEVIGKPWEDWLEDAEKHLKEVQDLETKMTSEGKGWWTRYCLCRQMADKTKAMTEFIRRNSTEPVFHPAPLPGIQFYDSSSENFTYFESTKVAHDQLWKALQDDSIYMIGLYGMGGSGKTTLVTEVGRKAEKLNLCDRAIKVTVSQTPDIRGIQGKVADMINLELKKESEEGRAQEIWLRLKGEQRVLIIVDDLWRKFRLEEIGVCLENDYKGRWKILLTTRSRDVCDSMKCQPMIELHLLSEDEAWTLFKKHADINDAFSKSLSDVPQQLCKECKGLPIAIETVGSSLKGKESNAEWDVALNRLRHSEAIDNDVEEGLRPVFNCLKLSYDNLQNKDPKLLFLMCCMFPEDYEISIEDLIRYAVGLGLCGKASLHERRNEIIAVKNKLVNSCLLMHSGESEDHVKMHDMVRDAALWIASRSVDHKILVNLDKPLGTLAEEDDVKVCFALSSWFEGKDQISVQVNAPNLKILLLNSVDWDSLHLSHASFAGIQGLKVMGFRYRYYTAAPLSMPESTQLLVNLGILRLHGFDLGDVSFLTSLTRLEILDLQRCSFKKLPNNMEKIKKLKLLDLSGCKIKESCTYEAIGQLSQLEELYVSGYINNNNGCEGLVDILTHPNLQRFAVHHGSHSSFGYAKIRRSVGLSHINISTLGVSRKKNLLQRAEHVELSHLGGSCKNFTPDVVGVVGCMKSLTSLYLHNCNDIECFIDTTSNHVDSLQLDDLFPRLIKLHLKYMEYLQELCRGPPLQVLGFFEKLKELHIMYCPELQSIFPGECNLHNLKILRINTDSHLEHERCGLNYTAGEVLFSMSVAQSLEQLEELTIEACYGFEHIIASGVKDGSYTSEEAVPARRNSHLMFPNLKTIQIRCCTSLEFILPISCVEGLAQLEELEISDCSRLKYVFGHYGHEGHSSCQNETQIMLPLLKKFNLHGLENIKGVCPENYDLRCPSLIDLSVSYSPKFTTCFTAEMFGLELAQQQHLNTSVAVDGDQPMNLTTNLKQLELHGLHNCMYIWSSSAPNQKWSLQYLKRLYVFGCWKLKSIFPMAVHTSLPQLTSLEILSCWVLEEIISETGEHEDLSNVELFFPKLRFLKVSRCNKLKSLFSVGMIRMLPQLRILFISDARQLEEVFRYGSEDGSVNQMEIVLPNLTEITLSMLPSFVDICHRSQLPAVKLRKLDIHGCPKTSSTLRTIEESLDRRQPVMSNKDEEEEEDYDDDDI